MPEIWKPVPQYNYTFPDGNVRYEVSDMGCIRNAGHGTYRGGWRKPSILKQSVDDNGYFTVRLRQSNLLVRTFNVHGLVALAFVDNPNGYTQVRHINGDKSDNRACNIEWVESGDQIDITHMCVDMMANGEYSKNGIRQYSPNGELVHTYLSSLDVIRHLNCRASVITYYCKHKLTGRLRFGHVWRFADDDELYELPIDERVKCIGLRGVRQYNTNKCLIKEFQSAEAAAEHLGVVPNNIRRCCDRLQITFNGYIWRYADDDELAELPENSSNWGA